MRPMRPILFAFVLALALSGCFRHEQKQQVASGDHSAEGYAPGVMPPPAMQVRLEQTRMLDTVMSGDVSGGAPMTFVYSLDTTRPHPAGARFDRMTAFTWSAQDSTWHEALTDTFAFGTTATLKDITGDGKPDIVLSTTSGLDDSIAATGCVVYSAHGGAWKEVFTAQTGNPQFQDVDNNGAVDILLQDEYAGVMPQTDAVQYISDIYSFDGTMFSSAKQRFPAYFDKIIAKAKDDYARIKTQVPVTAAITDEFDFTLYKPCIAVFVSYYAEDNKAGAREFWNQEREYLSRMVPSGQLIDLESFAMNM